MAQADKYNAGHTWSVPQIPWKNSNNNQLIIIIYLVLILFDLVMTWFKGSMHSVFKMNLMMFGRVKKKNKKGTKA